MAISHLISVFLPAFNEEGNFERSTTNIAGAPKRVTTAYEIPVINDGRIDRPGGPAEGPGRENPRIRAVQIATAAYHRALDKSKLDHLSLHPAAGDIAGDSVRDIFATVGRADTVAPYNENPRPRQLRRRFRNGRFGLRTQYCQGFPIYFLTEMVIHALHAWYTRVEIELTHVDRTHGRSKAGSVKDILRAMRAIGQTWWAIHVRHALTARRT